MRIWGLRAILNANFKKSVAQKLHRIILLHFGQVNVDSFWENPATLIFMVFGRSGRDNDSQNQYYLFLETQGYSK